MPAALGQMRTAMLSPASRTPATAVAVTVLLAATVLLAVATLLAALATAAATALLAAVMDVDAMVLAALVGAHAARLGFGASPTPLECSGSAGFGRLAR
jgi:hypothetical protein